MSTPEGRVKNRIRRLFKKHKVYYTMPNTHGYGRSGVADFICCHRGTFLAIEAKAGKNKATKLQQHELDKVLMAGGWAMVVNEDLLESLDGLLTEITNAANRRKAKFDEAHDALMDTEGKQLLKMGDTGGPGSDNTH